MPFDPSRRSWFLTWTTYGTWLPGDERGFVSPKFEQANAEPRHNQVQTPYDQGRESLHFAASSHLKQEPVFLEVSQANAILEQFHETASFKDWLLNEVAILSNHIHVLLTVDGDPDPEDLLKYFKSYASRKLNRLADRRSAGKWWTEQGSKRKIIDEAHFVNVTEYIRNQQNPLVTWSRDK